MHFKELHLQNLGPFRGDSVFDLTVSKGRPVVLFGGKNGAGKTNILEAVRLCLYGRYAFGHKLSENEYQRELSNRVHKHSSVEGAFVSVSFILNRQGAAQQFTVQRSWKRGSDGLYSEELAILEDGSLIHSILPDHWQEFINDLLPPSLSQLFFFDGERIQELASEDQEQAADALSDAVKSLFGISLIDRLSSDLSLIEKEAGSRGDSERSKQISLFHCELSDHKAELQKIDQKVQTVADRIGRERNQQLKIEEELKRRGGTYAKKREALAVGENEASIHLKSLESAFRSQCDELLPFLFCVDLVEELQDDIRTHIDGEAESIGARVIRDKAIALEGAFSSRALTKVDKSLSESQRTKLKSYVDGLLAQLLTPVKKVKGQREIDLSRTDVTRLQGWLHTTLTSTRKQAVAFSSDLEHVSRELMSARQELERVPSEEDLKPLFMELKAISERLGGLLSEEKVLSEEAKAVRQKIKDIELRLDKLAKEAVRASDLSTVFDRSIAARQAVRKFGVSLTKRRLEALAVEVLNTYNALARKQDMVSHITIDPESYKLQVFSRSAGYMPKDRLSTGERQILAISILWALAKLSGRAFPMIVDTPLGRLDSDHRSNLVSRYFTSASHQILVLSTDEEVDEHFYRNLAPHMSRTFHLDYDSKVGATAVKPGYFWSES